MTEEISSSWLKSFRREDSSRSSMSFNRRGITVCVTGGKGGVGKTSIAIKLSLELVYHNKKVLLIDCDHNLSNTAIKLGLDIDNNFLKLMQGKIKFEDALYKRGNFHLLGGCNGNDQIFEKYNNFKAYLSSFIADRKKEYDYIILDSPSGITDQTVFFASYCDERIFVINPDGSSITDAYSLIKIISKKSGIKDNFLIVNKVQFREQFDRVVRIISETAENYLGVRSHILGGIDFLGLDHYKFDQSFLSRKKSLFNQNFLIIIDKFLEKCSNEKLNTIGMCN